MKTRPLKNLRSRVTVKSFLEAPAGFEPALKVLQTSALPLGYGATLERKTGFEPATLALARRCSTPEPLPHDPISIQADLI